MNPHTFGKGCLGGYVMTCRVCGPAADQFVAIPMPVQEVARLAVEYDAQHAHPVDAPAFVEEQPT